MTWKIAPTGNRLHHVAQASDNTLNAGATLTACGRNLAGLSTPGKFTAALCVRCTVCSRVVEAGVA